MLLRLINNSAVANLIREGKIAQVKSVLETGAAAGMITLDKSLRQLYKAGMITKEDAISHMEDSRDLEE